MKTSIVYDRVNKWGGAERVLLALNEIFPNAVLYTAVYHSEKANWAKIFPKVIPTFLNKLAYLQDKHELLGTFTPIAFESLDFSECNLVISVTSEAAKGIITKPGTYHICYCLTPTRYLWSHYDFYFRNPLLKILAQPAVHYLRKWDRIAAQRPDLMVAISSAVKRRIQKYYGRDSAIIFPPVDVNKFKVKTKNLKHGDYFLFVSRLIPYKRPDLAVQAFNDLGLALIVVGTGSEEQRLKSIAGKNIRFTGQVSEQDLVKYYQKARALIFPGEEDFGIVMVEAQAAGVPVIAYKKGGALDIVHEGKTGIFFDHQDIESLKDAVSRFLDTHIDSAECVRQSEKFSKEIFKKKFLQLVNKSVKVGIL